jgi:uncharacterized membrane protein
MAACRLVNWCTPDRIDRDVSVHGRFALPSANAEDLIRMVPTSLPSPSLLVTLTGFFELTGAFGLLVPSTAAAASYGLIALLVAIFPANVHAAREGLVIAGRRASPLMWRLPLQLFWILTLWRVARASAGA